MSKPTVTFRNFAAVLKMENTAQTTNCRSDTLIKQRLKTDSVVSLRNSLQLTQYLEGKRNKNSIEHNDNRNEYNCSAFWLLYESLY